MDGPTEQSPQSHDADPDRWRSRTVELLENRRRIESADVERAPDGKNLTVEATIDTGSTLVVPVAEDETPRSASRIVRARLNRHFD